MNTMNFFFSSCYAALADCTWCHFLSLQTCPLLPACHENTSSFSEFSFLGRTGSHALQWKMTGVCALAEAYRYMYTVRPPSLAVVWSKKIGMYLPSGFFSQKKMATKHLLPHLLTVIYFLHAWLCYEYSNGNVE